MVCQHTGFLGKIEKMIRGWFAGGTRQEYNGFIQALLTDDVKAMNEFMNKIALKSFSSFDIAKSASGEDEPERFYHGFILGLMAGLEETVKNALTKIQEKRYEVELTAEGIPAENIRKYGFAFEGKRCLIG